MFRRILRILGINFLIGLAIFLIAELLLGNSQELNLKTGLEKFGFYELYTLFIGGANMFLFSRLNAINWKKKGVLRATVGVFSAFLTTVICLFFLRYFTQWYFEPLSIWSFIDSESVVPYVFGGSITVLIVLGITFFYIYKEKQEKKVEQSQLVAKTVSASFESLKNQIDPHFLFNSLNVLTALIAEDPEKAEDFTTKLSKVYRYVLEQKSKDLIPVEEELRFAKTYMDLIAMRFEDSISYRVNMQGKDLSDFKIVPLTLQLLLENCIKHNKVPMEISIVLDDNYIIVENTYKPKDRVSKGTGTGLSNIENRYALISQRSVIIEKSRTAFRVKVPLLTQEAKAMEIIDYNNEDKYMRAKARVKSLKEFYGSVFSFLIMMPVLVYINYSTYWGFQWFWFAGFGWGIGIVIQAFTLFGIGKDWEAKQINKYMKEDE